MAATSNRIASHASVIRSAAGSGIRPARACADASADSKRSIAASHATSEVASAIRAVVRLGPNRRSDGNEDGLVWSLEMDVEMQSGGGFARDESVPSRLLDMGQKGIARQCVRVGRKVDARSELSQEPAREDEQVEMRRVDAFTVGHRGGPADREVESALLVGPAPRELLTLEHLENRVGHGGTGAVEDLAFDSQRAGRARRHRFGVTGERHGEAEEGSHGLGRRRNHQPSAGVASRPRSTMSHRKPRAHSGTVVSRSKRDIKRSRPRWSGIELRIGSSGMRGSPGKYICVTSRLESQGPNTEKWMCAGRHALAWFFH